MEHIIHMRELLPVSLKKYPEHKFFFFSPQQDGFRLINWYENTKRDYEATVDRFGSFLFLGCA